VRRRIAGSAATWPLAARKQQPQRVRRIGVLMNYASDNPEGQARLDLFLKGLDDASTRLKRAFADCRCWLHSGIRIWK